MKASRRELKAMKEEVRQGPDHSDLFWWMVDHHADLFEEGRGGRMPWIKLCKRFAARGLTDGTGKVPTPARAGKTWRDACAEVKAAAERAAAAAQPSRPSPPSRQRPDWQPPVAATPRAKTESPREELPSRQPHVAPAPQTSPGDTGSSELDDLPPEVKAKFDRLRQDFAETDRKRFGRF
jgi:hypothetical protein